MAPTDLIGCSYIRHSYKFAARQWPEKQTLCYQLVCYKFAVLWVHSKPKEEFLGCVCFAVECSVFNNLVLGLNNTTSWQHLHGKCLLSTNFWGKEFQTCFWFVFTFDWPKSTNDMNCLWLCHNHKTGLPSHMQLCVPSLMWKKESYLVYCLWYPSSLMSTKFPHCTCMTDSAQGLPSGDNFWQESCAWQPRHKMELQSIPPLHVGSL